MQALPVFDIKFIFTFTIHIYIYISLRQSFVYLTKVKFQARFLIVNWASFLIPKPYCFIVFLSHAIQAFLPLQFTHTNVQMILGSTVLCM